MKGLGYIKGQEHPIAGEDNEYPDWLWGLLHKKGGSEVGSEDGAKGDMFSKSKKQRRIAAKAARKAALDPASRIPKVPYDRQTIDLPVAVSQDGRVRGDMAEGPRGWEEAQRAREDLTQAMRYRRRKEIKDSNYLKSIKS
ncbi:hypothetical protein MMC07_001512 [Pseudocyphellaria aurata]|nr:hypothetical protein [Pseudocyphellaria aurata]